MADHHDPRLRELTYRLVQMAPQAPPFPEETVTQLKPRLETKQPHVTQRRPWLVGLAAAAAVVVFLGVPLLLLPRLTEEQTPATQPPGIMTTVASTTGAPATEAPTTTIAPQPVVPVEAKVYGFGELDLSSTLVEPGAAIGGPVLRPFNVEVADDSPAGLIAAMIDIAQLEDNEIIPMGSDTELLGLSMSDGVASIDFNAAFYDMSSVTETQLALGTVVYALTQFDDIDSVLFLRDGEIADVVGADGIVLDGPQTREGYYDLLPLIFIDSPADGATVEPTFTISGLANTFEASLAWRIYLDDGTTVAEGFDTATCGSGCWGEYAIDIDRLFAVDTHVHIELFEYSAKDGSVQNRTEIEVDVLGTDSTDG